VRSRCSILLPLGLWFARYPRTYFDTLGAWALYAAHIRNPLDWARAWSNIQTLSVCGNVFWGFFSPSSLFLSTGAPGQQTIFLLPTGLLLVWGVVDIVARWNDMEPRGTRTAARLVLFGFIIGPLAAATFKQNGAVQRTLVIVPFGVLLATSGLSDLWGRYQRWNWRWGRDSKTTADSSRSLVRSAGDAVSSRTRNAEMIVPDTPNHRVK